MKKVTDLIKLCEEITKIDEQVNLDIINMFVNNNVSEDDKESYCVNNLKLVKMPEGWVLMNYSTPISYRDNSGKVYLNSTKYSITTSKIRGQVKNNLVAANIAYDDIDEQGLLGKIYKK